MTRPTEPPEKRASVMSAIVMPFWPTERRDARGRIEELRHAGRAARPFVADDHHVVVGEDRRRVLERGDERRLAVEDARPPVKTPSSHAALDARRP
jgi:hypothetical protein